MSKLEELIEELCPDGVEYITLGESCDIKTGKGITKKDSVDDGDYPIISGGKEPMGFYHSSNRDAYTTTVSRVGANAGFVCYIEVPFYLNDKCFSVIPMNRYEKLINSKYLYYVLKNDEQKIVDMQSEGGVPTINTQKISGIFIPIPPLPVQEEIVRILDNFTDLIAELQTELQARAKQYDYYRDALIYDNNYQYKSIDELCKVSAGGDAPKDAISKEKTEEYTIPIISNGIGDNALYGYTNSSKINDNAVTVAARGTIGYAEYRDYPYYPIIRLLTLIPKEKGKLDAKYLYYCLQGKQYKVPTTGIPQLTAPMVKQVEIPIPCIDMQREIVRILDNFNNICSSISEGLPAEIDARQKQYEYYRNKLLTFKELGA